MDADGLPLVGPGVDLTKVGAIHPKRLLAFLNHFVTHTTRFLNKFSCVCEQKLSDLNTRIQRLEVTMNILEAKLASIPGLEGVSVEATPAPGPTPEPEPAAAANLPALPPSEEQNLPAVEPAPEAPPTMTVSQDPRYMKYFKMINMGVPVGALRQKLTLEGLNPDLLDTPNAPAPPAAQDDSDSTFSESSEEQEEFSD
ncbi:WASH complex subunit 3-like [Acanthaster planci]|uniref:WASH complex subunit 3 n=1 Tax=Acanthaster planci TaxID=133434 RepID=A0A8B7YNI5_ACAPL|nr:WASH complex subunit 3-like [Acanthaster planci]